MRSRPFLILVNLVVVLSACKTVESAACSDLRNQAREAMQQGRLDEASKTLDRARSECSEKSAYDIRRIEELIAEKTEQQRERESEEAEEKRVLEKRPTVQFVNWIAKDRNAITKEVTEVHCAERGSPDFGFCEAQRPGSPDMTVRYWEQDTSAFRYAFTAKVPLACQDLGDHRRVRTWAREGKTYELCELARHELRSLSALLVKSAGENQLFVFSQAYVQKDEDFEALLKIGH